MTRILLAGGIAALLLAVAPLAASAQAPAATAPDPSTLGPTEGVRAPPVPPQAFRTPEEGFAALAAAIRTHDGRRMLRVLGEDARRLVRSADPATDRAMRERFIAAWDAKHEIVRAAPDRAVLQVGEDLWPLPIPMRLRGGTWRFDAREGAQAIIDREVGRNELDIVEVLRAVVDAQDEYADTVGRQGPFRAYARRFFSSPGQRDGLYFATAEDEPPSPLGPLAAAASAGGYARSRPGDAPQPYHGYYFRMLERQGPAAPGGELDYIVNGRMIGGFGVIAWPAQYARTGIKTFIVNHRGEVYERDLGPDTARIAGATVAFDPEPGWTRVAE